MVQGEFYETGRFAGSLHQDSTQSIQSTTAITSPAIASPVASSLSSAAYMYQPPATASAAVSSGSTQTGQPYYYVQGGIYYYWDNQKSIQVDRPKDVWVKNVIGWSEVNREKYWRFWDGKNTFYE